MKYEKMPTLSGDHPHHKVHPHPHTQGHAQAHSPHPMTQAQISPHPNAFGSIPPPGNGSEIESTKAVVGYYNSYAPLQTAQYPVGNFYQPSRPLHVESANKNKYEKCCCCSTKCFVIGFGSVMSIQALTQFIMFIFEYGGSRTWHSGLSCIFRIFVAISILVIGAFPSLVSRERSKFVKAICVLLAFEAVITIVAGVYYVTSGEFHNYVFVGTWRGAINITVNNRRLVGEEAVSVALVFYIVWLVVLTLPKLICLFVLRRFEKSLKEQKKGSGISNV